MDPAEQKRQIWTVGVKLIATGNGISGESARRILGKLAKQYSQELLATAIEVAVTENAVDPKAFIVAVIRERSQPGWVSVGRSTVETSELKDCLACDNTRRQHHQEVTDWQDPLFDVPCKLCI